MLANLVALEIAVPIFGRSEEEVIKISREQAESYTRAELTLDGVTRGTRDGNECLIVRYLQKSNRTNLRAVS